MRPTVESIARRFLYEKLRECESAPLESSVCAFMEARFGASFDEVRIRTGPAASALCRRLRARAFTFGRDIVFAEGEYTPDSPAGRWLLAHELVHVLQQRGRVGGGESPVVPVGASGDDCEREADRLADEALGTGLSSVVTPDVTGAIRRKDDSLDLTGGTAEIILDFPDGSDNSLNKLNPGYSHWPTPDPIPGNQFVLSHLGTGADVLQAQFQGALGNLTQAQALEKSRGAEAVRFTGVVPITLPSNLRITEAKDLPWSLHFRQYFASSSDKWFYAGRNEDDGEIQLDFSEALGTKDYLPDYWSSGKYNDETWFFPKPAVVGTIVPNSPRTTWFSWVTTGDHPSTPAPAIRPNKKRNGANNYLYYSIQTYSVVTVLVAFPNPSSPAYAATPRGSQSSSAGVPLASVRWKIINEARFRWKGSDDGLELFDPPVTLQSKHPYDTGKGAADQQLDGMVRLPDRQDPPGPSARVAIVAAEEQVKNAVNAGRDDRGVKIMEKRSGSVPKDTFPPVARGR
jgi:hypothetical protein